MDNSNTIISNASFVTATSQHQSDTIDLDTFSFISSQHELDNFDHDQVHHSQENDLTPSTTKTRSAESPQTLTDSHTLPTTTKDNLESPFSVKTISKLSQKLSSDYPPSYNTDKGILAETVSIPTADGGSSGPPSFDYTTGTGGDPENRAAVLSQRYKVYKRRWIGILALSLLNIMTSWGWLSFSALSTETTLLFGFKTDAPVNWLSTSVLFAYVVASPAVAWVLTRKSVKPAIIICAILCALGNWLRYIGVVKKIFGLLMVGQILIGIAQPFALSSTGYYTDMWFTSSSRVSANAISSISNPLGGAIAQLVGPLMVSDPSQLKTFILLTAALASAFGLVVLAVPSHPPLPPCPSAMIIKLSLRESLHALVRSPVYIALFSLFSIYVGLFNSYSTYINQIMGPYGYSSDEAGITGVILIVAGIVCCAIVSPLIDRTHNFVLLVKLAIPIMAACYIALNFTSTKSLQLIGPYLVSGVLGAVSFSILPALLEWVQEQTSPVTPALSSGILWNGGNFFGAIFIIIMNALKFHPDEGSPPGNMRNALIFQTVIAGLGLIPVWFVKLAQKNSRVVLDARRRTSIGS